MRTVRVEVVEEVKISATFDKNPILSKEEWRIVSRALLAYPETTVKLRTVAHVFLTEHRREV
jgi:hypothetical protein